MPSEPKWLRLESISIRPKNEELKRKRDFRKNLPDPKHLASFEKAQIKTLSYYESAATIGLP